MDATYNYGEKHKAEKDFSHYTDLSGYLSSLAIESRIIMEKSKNVYPNYVCLKSKTV